jgi:hypothetical protein
MDDKSLNLWRQINGLRSRGRKPMLPGAGDRAAATPVPGAPSPGDR